MAKESLKESLFEKALRANFPGREKVVENALKNLRKIGIDHSKLEHLKVNGLSVVFTYKESFVVKITTILTDNYEITDNKTKVLDKFVLGDLKNFFVGYDMGEALVECCIASRLNTEDVTDEHVKALCFELEKFGFIFWDNKIDNVGLTKEGLPYIIDVGAIANKKQNPNNKYHCPKLSGYNQETGIWDSDIRKYMWPEHQKDNLELQTSLQKFNALAEGTFVSRPDMQRQEKYSAADRAVI